MEKSILQWLEHLSILIEIQIFFAIADMIAATSVLQQQAGDIRSKTINWASYMQSQMITPEDYTCISALDKSKAVYLQQNPSQAVKTLLSLLSHVSKDSTIQYILVMIDDLLQEDRTRVDFFHDYAAKRKECVWGPFLNLLNRQDGFIVNMSSRILAKLACWGHESMPTSDLNFYLQFLKDQLTVKVSRSPEVVDFTKSWDGPFTIFFCFFIFKTHRCTNLHHFYHFVKF